MLHRSPRHALRHAIAAIAAIAFAATLAACGGQTPAAPAGSASSAGAGGTAAPSPSASPSPTVKPATGPVIDSDPFSVHLPEGWTKRKSLISSWSANGVHRPSGSRVYVNYRVNLQDPRPLDVAGQQAMEGLVDGFPHKVTAGPTLHEPYVLNGVDYFHASVTGDSGIHEVDYEVYGLDTQTGFHAEFTFIWTHDPGMVLISEDERAQIVTSMLASIQWKPTQFGTVTPGS